MAFSMPAAFISGTNMLMLGIYIYICIFELL